MLSFKRLFDVIFYTSQVFDYREFLTNGGGLNVSLFEKGLRRLLRSPLCIQEAFERFPSLFEKSIVLKSTKYS